MRERLLVEIVCTPAAHPHVDGCIVYARAGELARQQLIARRPLQPDQIAVNGLDSKPRK